MTAKTVCEHCKHPLSRHHERSGCNERIPTRSGDSVPCYCLVKAVKPCTSANCT